VGDPAGSNATAGLALRVTGTHKPLHHDKVKILSVGPWIYFMESINLDGGKGIYNFIFTNL
jgi:hypothetical protein